jgi:hypothetical protein
VLSMTRDGEALTKPPDRRRLGDAIRLGKEQIVLLLHSSIVSRGKQNLASDCRTAGSTTGSAGSLVFDTSSDLADLRWPGGELRAFSSYRL